MLHPVVKLDSGVVNCSFRSEIDKHLPVDVLIIFVRAQMDCLEYFLVRVSDVSERKSDKAWVRFHANYDLLTRPLNRQLLIKRLDAALRTASEHGRQGGVLLLNIDRFKVINDTFGYAIGDELLRLAAQRLDIGKLGLRGAWDDWAMTSFS